MNADKRLGWIINQPSVLIAIDKVLGGHKKNGYPRAMTLVPKAFLQLEFQS